MPQLICQTLPRYDKRDLKPGQKFEAEEKHVALLCRTGLARLPGVRAGATAAVKPAAAQDTPGDK